MALFEDMERLKLRFLAAFQQLTDKGVLNEQQLEEIIEIVDKLDDLSVAEIEEQLGRFIPGGQFGESDEQHGRGGDGDATTLS